jgi:oligoribonuclease
MAQDKNHLIWIDMEMSGLKPEEDRIIEVAIVVTDSQLNTVAEAAVLVVHQADSVLDGMDSWNKSTHAKSGLIEKVKASTLADADVEKCHAFLPAAIRSRARIADVRQFHLPGSALSRPLDAAARAISTTQSRREHAQGIGEALEAQVASGLVKHGKHEALADVYESIEELSITAIISSN